MDQPVPPSDVTFCALMLAWKLVADALAVTSIGAVAALLHTLNNSVCKVVSFCCAGSLGQVYGSHDMRRMTSVLRVSPVWGGGLVCSLLALMGVAPFGLFVEIQPYFVEGLIHVSELAEGNFLHPRNVVTEGQLVRARILAIDGAARRLGLSLRLAV